MRRAKNKRRGAAVLEMVIVLFWFLVLTMCMLDFGVAVFRYHILSQAARHGARRAIVHGEMASPLGVWGHDIIDRVPITATGIPIVGHGGTDDTDGLKRMLIGCDPNETRITVEWLNGSNAVGEPVRVTVTSPYQPVVFLNILQPIQLRASSRMTIAH
jgi:hypothetical protein